MLTFNHKHRQKGLTLIEVMVALVILSVGLLGLAGLQLAGIRGSSGSNYRVQAVLAANDLADRMHTNVEAVDVPNTFANIVIQTNNCPAIAVDCTAANCTEAQMAAFDLRDICLNVANTLPQPATITVTCNDSNGLDADACTDGSTHTLAINWNEVTDSAVNAGTRAQAVAMTITP